MADSNPYLFLLIPEIGFPHAHTRPKVPARTRPKIPAQFSRKYANLQITVLTYFYRRHNKHTTTLAQFQTRICKHNSLLYVKNLINQQFNISL
jgi:hypothetical protein